MGRFIDAAWQIEMVVEEKVGFCTLCRSRCGTINIVEGGRRLVEVRANPAHPTGKAICPKGRAAPEIVHSARRLTTPLRRTARKGASDPGFVPISWEEALDIVAKNLDSIRSKWGAESVAFAVTSGSSSSISDSLEWVQRFVRGFGSPNNCVLTEVCNWHKEFAHAFTFGCGIPTADYRRSDLILLWGHNPANVWLAQAEAIGAARAAGARVAVIDPRHAGSAKDADLWLRVRPGTDGVLALALARILIQQDAFDRAFVTEWTNGPYLVREDSGRFLRGIDLGWSDNPDGFVSWVNNCAAPAGLPGAELSGVYSVDSSQGKLFCRTAFDHYAEATKDYDLSTASRITGIPIADIETLAAAIARASSVSYHCWTGVGQHLNATQTERAIANLYALTGAFDRPGGNVLFPSQPVPSLHSMEMIPAETRAKALGLDERPLGPPADGWITPTSLYDSVLTGQPYKIRALMGFGSNLLVSHPGGERGREALEALEFQVHCDLFMNPTAQYADIVLPVSSAWEHEALRIGFEISLEAQEWVQLRQPMLQPIGQGRSDMWIVFQLATRLGMNDLFFNGELEAGFDYLLAPLGLNAAELRRYPGGRRFPLEITYEKYKKKGFATDTGRVELYSERLLRHGYPPVPRFFDVQVDSKSGFPLTVFSSNNGYFCHGQHRGIVSLRRRRPEPLASIHPDAAGLRGIHDGDWIRIRSEHGAIKVRARLDSTLHPATIACDYGWWEAAPDLGLESHQATAEVLGANFNALLGERLRDPISGSLPMRSLPCDVVLERRGNWPGWRSLKVVNKRSERGDVTVLELRPADQEGDLVAFRPGQFITLDVNGVRRSYSIVSPASSAPRAYEIAVRHVPGGLMSTIIDHKLQVDDLVLSMSPQGSFVLPTDNEFPLVLVAGGIGITPFLSFLETLVGSPTEPQIVLHYVAKNEESASFHGRLTSLVAKLPNLRMISHFSRSGRKEGQPHGQRFSANLIEQEWLDRRARFYLCANETMMDEATAILLSRGVPPFEIFRERFSPPVSIPSGPRLPRQVSFTHKHQTATWLPEMGYLLNFMDSLKIKAPSGCRVGQCESCAVKLVKGEVMHVSDAPQPEPGICLTCIAVPLTDIVLDL